MAYVEQERFKAAMEQILKLVSLVERQEQSIRTLAETITVLSEQLVSVSARVHTLERAYVANAFGED